MNDEYKTYLDYIFDKKSELIFDKKALDDLVKYYDDAIILPESDISISVDDRSSYVDTPMIEIDVNAKMLLFARWITTQFGTPQYNVNGYDGSWWKTQLNHFNDVVYPNYIKNGSAENTKKFLEE
jgi:hypothetical protein